MKPVWDSGEVWGGVRVVACCVWSAKGMWGYRNEFIACVVMISGPPCLPSPMQKVFVTSFLKTFGKEASKDSTVGVFLCRTEDLAGFPEIIMEGHMDFVIKFPGKTFTSVDPKSVVHAFLNCVGW